MQASLRHSNSHGRRPGYNESHVCWRPDMHDFPPPFCDTATVSEFKDPFACIFISGISNWLMKFTSLNSPPVIDLGTFLASTIYFFFFVVAASFCP